MEEEQNQLIYEQGVQDSREEGRAEGRAEAQIEFAKRLFDRGMSKETVSELTGLGMEQLAQLL